MALMAPIKIKTLTITTIAPIIRPRQLKQPGFSSSLIILKKLRGIAPHRTSQLMISENLHVYFSQFVLEATNHRIPQLTSQIASINIHPFGSDSILSKENLALTAQHMEASVLIPKHLHFENFGSLELVPITHPVFISFHLFRVHIIVVCCFLSLSFREVLHALW
jgi:hypothetical protein